MSTGFRGRETTVEVAMEATSLVVTVRAKNVGDQPEPMGIGWHPRFAILSGHRDGVTVRLPAAEGWSIGTGSNMPRRGRWRRSTGGRWRLWGRGRSLGWWGLDEGLVRLKGEATAEMRDPAARYGVRMTGVSESGSSPTIRELRVYAPADQGYVSLGMQTNLDSPLSRVWAGMRDCDAAAGAGDGVEGEGGDFSGVGTVRAGGGF